MDSNQEGGPSGETVFQLQYWQPTNSLHVLWSHATEVVRFVPSPITGLIGEGESVADLAGRDFFMGQSFSLHRSRALDDSQWTHIGRLVVGESVTDIGFAR